MTNTPQSVTAFENHWYHAHPPVPTEKWYYKNFPPEDVQSDILPSVADHQQIPQGCINQDNIPRPLPPPPNPNGPLPAME